MAIAANDIGCRWDKSVKSSTHFVRMYIIYVESICAIVYDQFVRIDFYNYQVTFLSRLTMAGKVAHMMKKRRHIQI